VSKALVLSGGGPLGIAWETGIAAGLAAKGVDFRTADFILGTSAGSSVGAQIALGRDLGPVVERYRSRAQRPPSEGVGVTAPASAADERAATPGEYGTSGPMQDLMRMMARAESEGRTPEQARAAVGRYALDADTVPEDSFVNGFRHLRGEEWPARYACTAVDAETGEFVVWNAENPVELERAVASSCAVPGIYPPITINGRRYIDGGLRSGASADLAAGHGLVLIVTLRDPDAATDGNPQLERAQRRIADERKVIEDGGGKVVTVAPDADAAAAMGTNPHDSSVSPAAAAAGFRQGEGEADRLREFWT
jgi:NTE family protein